MENVEILTTCEKCGEATRIKFEGFEYPVACKCRQKEIELEQVIEKNKKIESLQIKSGIPREYRNAFFENAKIVDENAKVFEKAKRYVDNCYDVYQNNLGLYIWGSNSSGKTHLTCCIANELIKKNVSVLFTSLLEINNDYFKGEEIFKKLESVGFLFIDDLGQEFKERLYNKEKNAFIESILKKVLDTRVNAGKPIIITSNYKFDSLAKELDFNKAIMERLNVAVARVYELNGINFRQDILKQNTKLADKLGI